MKIKHVFFDLDHTLWDFEKNSAKTFKHIFTENNIDVDIHKFLHYYKSINFEYWRLYRVDKISKEALRYGRLRDTFDKIKFNATDELIHLLSEEYIKYLSTFNYLFDGAIELLDYLNRKYDLHIITNGFNEVQNKKIVNSKIDRYFSQIITSEMVGVKKPNPKVFEYALEKAGAKANESVMIGDSWEADIMGAKAFNMNVIYCNFDNESVDESISSVKNLYEIRKYL